IGLPKNGDDGRVGEARRVTFAVINVTDGAAAACATRAQQLERTAALLSYRSGRREPQRSVSGGGQDRLKRSLMNSGSHPEAVLGPGAIALDDHKAVDLSLQVGV